jgi:hypothetical protein
LIAFAEPASPKRRGNRDARNIDTPKLEGDDAIAAGDKNALVVAIVVIDPAADSGDRLR